MEFRHRLLLLIGLAVVSVSLLWFFHSNADHAPARNQRGVEAANATLGFGAVLAVSRKGSPRRQPLLSAANITGLDIVIPDQPVWTDQDVREFLAERNSRITRGSALAWLGHLNALKWFLDTDLETVLILEDDVDWDIHLRTVQVPKLAAATRKLLRPPGWSTYWGDLRRWEILYLGHCGDFFSPDQLPSVDRETFRDDTLPPFRRMHTQTEAWLRRLGFPEYQRMVHRSKWPLCTFGYAVNRKSAHRILTELAAREPDGGCQAFDVRILEACRDLGYLCYSTNPELFHHIEAPSEIANVNQGIDGQGRLQRQTVEGTPNINCGARSSSFYTTNEDTLKFLKQAIGVKGQCLIDQMAEDNGRWPW